MVAALRRGPPRVVVRWTDPRSARPEPNERGRPSGGARSTTILAAAYRLEARPLRVRPALRTCSCPAGRSVAVRSPVDPRPPSAVSAARRRGVAGVRLSRRARRAARAARSRPPSATAALARGAAASARGRSSACSRRRCAAGPTAAGPRLAGSSSRRATTRAAARLRPLVRGEPENVTAWTVLALALAAADPAAAARPPRRSRRRAGAAPSSRTGSLAPRRCGGARHAHPGPHRPRLDPPAGAAGRARTCTGQVARWLAWGHRVTVVSGPPSRRRARWSRPRPADAAPRRQPA